jgi:hypothetical protein
MNKYIKRQIIIVAYSKSLNTTDNRFELLI